MEATMEIPSEIAEIIEDALTDPHQREWSLQGFGMMRLCLDDAREWRLHVWDSRYRKACVDSIHNHPWDFQSRVLSGALVNRRYLVHPFGWDDGEGGPERPTHWQTEILCGEGASTVGERVPVVLEEQPLEIYVGKPGMNFPTPFVQPKVSDYSQRWDEVHDTEYLDGTVSIVRRSFSREDRDHALVYVPDFREWVDAEPRPATEEEIANIITSAAERWTHQD